MLLWFLPHTIAGDDNQRFADIEQLLHHGHLTDSRYSLVGPLLSAPFLLLGEVVASPRWFASHFNVIVVALGLAAAWELTRDRVDARLFRKFALVLLFASFLTNRLRDYNTEIVTATLVVLGTLAVTTARRALLGWTAIVVGVVNTPAALGGLVLVAAARAAASRRGRPFLAVGAAVALVGLEAWIRRGSPFTTGYEGDRGAHTIMPYSGRPGFSYPFVLGLAAILFSFGRGLVFFAPGLLLWLDARLRRLVPGRPAVVLQLAFLVGLVLVYSRWWAWYGGLSWGPRFFVLASAPASLLLATRLQARSERLAAVALTLAVLALSAWVGLDGAIENGSLQQFCEQNGFQHEHLCWFTPDYSALWWPALHFPALSASAALLSGYCCLVYVWLAAPLVAALVARLTWRPEWAHGWRF